MRDRSSNEGAVPEGSKREGAIVSSAGARLRDGDGRGILGRPWYTLNGAGRLVQSITPAWRMGEGCLVASKKRWAVSSVMAESIFADGASSRRPNGRYTPRHAPFAPAGRLFSDRDPGGRADRGHPDRHRRASVRLASAPGRRRGGQ